MRVRLRKGVQRRLIASLKHEKNFTWKQLARFLDIKLGALLSWYKEENLLPESIYFKIGGKNSNILLRLEDGWGRSKGGKLSSGTLKPVHKPLYSIELAELIGIILGDGNVHSYDKGGKLRSYMVRIGGDAIKDKEYLASFVFNLSKKIFGIEPKLHYQKGKNELFVILHSKLVVAHLVALGLKPGNKLKSRVDIPLWIKANPNYMRACLRGLVDTDGCVSLISKKSKLIRISYKSFSPFLIASARKALVDLGFHHSKVICSNVIYLSRQNEVEKYLKEIGFSNPKHLTKLSAL